jgi:hypothetical protein
MLTAALLSQAGCGGAEEEPRYGSSDHTNARSQEQSMVDAMRIVCVEAPAAVATVEDPAQRDYNYGRYVSTHITNPDVLRVVLKLFMDAPQTDRDRRLNAAARDVGLPDCAAAAMD